MKQQKVSILLITILSLVLQTAQAQQQRNQALINSDKNGWEYQLRAGVNLGGITPMPLPREIRAINHYSPRINATLQGRFTKWLDSNPSIGMSAALQLEQKGMKTESRVKGYHTGILYKAEQIQGYWTGTVTTNYSAALLTLPLSLDYRLTPAWKISGGAYLSYAFEGDFNGSVSDGYFRVGDPTGEKLLFQEGESATFDFSKQLNKLQYGLHVGTSWQAFKQFSVYADLYWGLSHAFPTSFNSISFKLTPVYLNLGFGYRF